MTLNLTAHQQEAADKVKRWYTDKDTHFDNPIFRLFGYAGTGKTTITAKIIEQLKLTMGDEVLFGAYTGKAAMVMRKNQLPASTIHALIYKVIEPDVDECKKVLERLNNPNINDFERGRFRQEYNDISKPRFQLRDINDGALKNAKLLVFDECSMVDKDMLLDLLTFDIPMLVLGDPGQLPPIEGKSPLTDVPPDAMLTEIHRQAQDNPIIYMATLARKGHDIPLGDYGNSRVVRMDSLTRRQMKAFDQVIAGKNTTRRSINLRMRQVHGFAGPYPEVGEKLICLRNNAEKGLFNGMICYVEEVGLVSPIQIEMKVRKETDGPGDPPTTVYVLRAHFDMYKDDRAMDRVSLSDRLSSDEFDYGYCITTHKAQGSQWDNVCLVDDGMFAGWGNPLDRERWLYTGITRAADRITIAH
jgi:exodeoxyribonuclease-5